MKLRSHIFPAGLIALLLAPTAALTQEGDPAAGKQVFNRCRACHEAETDRNKVGPSLLGVVGRTAGSLESFESRYSESMRQAGEEGLVWNEENLTEYLRDPKAVIPKGTMAFPGLKSDEDIANVIAYLKADPKP
ncbi:c-type cytochrome [Nitratireductor luteus]|uniref:c-type cytochrome n=1 Tax=Nitratireductor luteus TaxID=2976980 RepID=UPI00224097A3|nr:cytochrome c family protein [Nitratireductor luteus]